MITTIHYSKIKLNPDNPRTITDDKFKKLVKSIKEFPEMLEKRPIVVNKDMVILGGNMRYKACIEAGIEEIPVIIADDWDEAKQKEFVIKDNVSGGEWDWDTLANEWNADLLTDWGLDLPIGFGDPEEAEEDDYEIPDEVKTDIVVGDLFEIGEHRLLCGDSILEESYYNLFKDELSDLVVTDPPYNVGYVGKTKNALTIENDIQSNEGFYNFLLDFYTSMSLFTKKGGSWYVFHADSEGANFRLAMQNSGIMVKQCLIWVKQTMVMGRQDYQWKHEPVLYGWKEGASHRWFSDRKQTTVLEFNRPSKNTEHPTMKPIEILSYLIKNSSLEKDIVGDPFLGSGSTMVACHQLKRKCYGIEIDPKYCQVIVDRMLKLDPKLEVKRNGEKYINTANVQP